MRIFPGPHLTSVYIFLEAGLRFREKSIHAYDVLGVGKENIQGTNSASLQRYWILIELSACSFLTQTTLFGTGC